MTIDKSKLSDSTGEVEIINVKTDEATINKLIKQDGFYKAYHMNKKNWITILLDGTVKYNEIIKLIDKSYELIDKR